MSDGVIPIRPDVTPKINAHRELVDHFAAQPIAPGVGGAAGETQRPFFVGVFRDNANTQRSDAPPGTPDTKQETTNVHRKAPRS